MGRAANNHHSYEMIVCPCVRSLEVYQIYLMSGGHTWSSSHQQYCAVESTRLWWETKFSKFDTQREPGTRGRLVATQHSQYQQES